MKLSRLADAIYRDRRPYGWTQADATAAERRYLEWLHLLAKKPVLTPKGRDILHRVLDLKLLRPGRVSAVYAAQGRGKTNVLAVVTQLVLDYRRDWEVFTNVPYPWWGRECPRPPRLHLVESLSDLLRALSERALQGKWSAVIIDEFDQADTSHTWATEGSESWARYLFIARHYLTRGPLLVFHSFNFIPLPVRTGQIGSPFKLVVAQGKHRLVDVMDPKGGRRGFVGTFPETDLPYLTLGLRGFSLDVDVQELETRFVGPQFAGDAQAVARETLAFLNERKSAPTYREALARRRAAWAATHVGALARDEAILADADAGLTYREIQRKHHTSSKHISDLLARRFPLSASPGGTPPRAPEENRDSSSSEVSE